MALPAATKLATLVELQTSAVNSAEKEAILRAVSTAAVRPCFEALLLRSPLAYGDVVVEFTVGVDGLVSASRPQFSTLGDADAELCVAEAVRPVVFRKRDNPITVLYPFLLLTERTPPEVARALRDRYGLLPEAEADPTGDPLQPPPPGVVVVW